MRLLLVSLLVALGPLVPAHADETDPPLETSDADLAAALDCRGGFDDPDHEPLLLVHGTFTNARENWGWNWQHALETEGWDVCAVTLPNRSLDDMQVQAEYVVFAIRQMAAASGQKVDVMGHSQGGLHPRWAVKWWPDVRALVDDLVMLGAPNHGTAASAIAPPFGCFASCWQMGPESQYIAALNASDETPGEIDYTSVFTLFDELVLPQFPTSTSALDGAVNVAVQEVCPGRPVEHAGLMADLTAHDVAMDALVNPGPADPERIDPLASCTGVWFEGVDLPGHVLHLIQGGMDDGFPNYTNVSEEPPLKSYDEG